MAKKFGKFMLMSSIAAAAGAGVYYYLKGKKEPVPEDNFDADDFDDFDDDLDDDIEDTVKSHPHVSLDLDGAKERIGEKVIETLDKAKEFIGEVTSVNAEPVYTKVDLPPHEETPDASVSSTNSSAPSDKTETEEFFNDSEN